MTVLAVKTGNLTVRCREEEFGCFMFDSRAVCAEGNKTIFSFVKGLNEGKTPKAIAQEISSDSGASAEEVYSDLLRFLKVASIVGWFKDVFELEQVALSRQTQ